MGAGLDRILSKLKSGALLKRDSWPEWCHIGLQVPDANSRMGRSYIYRRNKDGKLEPFTLPTSDLLAEDWSIYEPKRIVVPPKASTLTTAKPETQQAGVPAAQPSGGLEAFLRMSNFGEALKRAREVRKIHPAKLAKHLGIKPETLAAIEIGESMPPSLENLRASITRAALAVGFSEAITSHLINLTRPEWERSIYAEAEQRVRANREALKSLPAATTGGPSTETPAAQ
jgi:transcriptional regulator with XRE-family HTH domain